MFNFIPKDIISIVKVGKSRFGHLSCSKLEALVGSCGDGGDCSDSCGHAGGPDVLLGPTLIVLYLSSHESSYFLNRSLIFLLRS